MKGNACISSSPVAGKQVLGAGKPPRPLFQLSDYSQVPSSPEVLVILMSCNVGNVPSAGPGREGTVLGHKDGSGLAGARSWGLGWERHGPLGALELGRGRQRPVRQPCGRSSLMAVHLSFVAASVQDSFQSQELSAACCLVLYLSPSAPSLSLPVSGVAFRSSHSLGL